MVIIASLHRLLQDGDCLTGEQCCRHFIVQNKANCDLTWGTFTKFLVLVVCAQHAGKNLEESEMSFHSP